MQASRAAPCARGRGFSAGRITQPYPAKAVTVMSDVFDYGQIRCGMPSDLE